MIRKAVTEDLPALEAVYAKAKAYMAATGNPGQWDEEYPECMLEGDISRGQLFVLCDDQGTVHAGFAFIIGDDPTYGVIEEGDWTSGEPYGTIHRLGSDGAVKGAFGQCLAFCRTLIDNIRADTHENNHTMRHLLEKHGFVRCGIIHVYDGSPRIAYQLPKEGSV